MFEYQDLACRRCLIYEMGDAPLYERIKRSIDAIPEAERSKKEEYQSRLEACKSCDRLISGMCRVCGCYVEVRAAYRKSDCPKPGKSLWKSDERP